MRPEMAEFGFPESEQVDTAELKKIKDGNRAFLEAQYLGQVSDFRAEVIQRMLGHNALHGRVGWLCYQEKAETQADVLVDDRGKETLIILFAADSPERQAPHIRIVTNTEYRLDEATAFFTEDVTVDNDGDAQLFIDTILVDDNGTALPSLDPECISCAPVFYIRGQDGLVTQNMQNFTPIFDVNAVVGNGDVSREVKVTPFGRYQNLEDRIAALEWGVNIVRATEQTELVAWNTGIV